MHGRAVWATAFSLVLLASTVFAAENDVILSSYNYEPAPAEAGETFELWIHVSNKSGRVLNNLVAESKFEYPFSLPAGEEEKKDLGSMVPGGTALINYEYVKVDPNTPSGDYEFEFSVGEKGGVGRNYFIKLQVNQKKPDIELIDVEFEPAVIQPGLENGVAKLVFKNLGKTAAFDVKARMDVPAAGTTADGGTTTNHIKPVGGPVAYIDKIPAGEQRTAEIRFAVDRDALLKTYLVPLKIEYKNENNVDFEFVRQIGAEVTDNPDLDVVLVAVEPLPIPGGKTRLSMDVFNAGGATANYVIVQPTSPAAKKIVPEKIFIGTLEPDDFDSFSFDVEIKEDAEPGLHPVHAKVVYRDRGWEREAAAEPVSLNVYSRAEAAAAAGEEFPWVPVAVVVVVAGFLFRKRILKWVGRGNPGE